MKVRSRGDVIGASVTETLLVVVEWGGRLSVKDLALLRGLSVSTTYGHLLRLRQHGLVTWEWGQSGTLRPTCGFVPLEP